MVNSLRSCGCSTRWVTPRGVAASSRCRCRRRRSKFRRLRHPGNSVGGCPGIPVSRQGLRAHDRRTAARGRPVRPRSPVAGPRGPARRAGRAGPEHRAPSDLHRFIADDDLAAVLFGAAVPVAPNRRVLASGSIASWLAHRRRPLVPDSEYTRGLARRGRTPSRCTTRTPPGDLRAAIDAPRPTRRRPGWPRVAAGPNLADVLTDYRAHFAGCCRRAPAVGPAGGCCPETAGTCWTVGARPGRRRSASSCPISTASPTSTWFSDRWRSSRIRENCCRWWWPTTGHPSLRTSARPATSTWSWCDNPTRASGRPRPATSEHTPPTARSCCSSTATPFPNRTTVRMSRLPALALLTVGRRRHADLAGSRPALVGRHRRRDADDVDGHRTGRAGPGCPTATGRAATCSMPTAAPTGTSSRRCSGCTGSCSTSWAGSHRPSPATAGRTGSWPTGPGPRAGCWLTCPMRSPGTTGRTGPVGGTRTSGRRITRPWRLARLLPDPVSRGGGQWLPYPAIVITLPGTDPAGGAGHRPDRIRRRRGLRPVADRADAAADTARLLADPRIAAGPPDRRRAGPRPDCRLPRRSGPASTSPAWRRAEHGTGRLATRRNVIALRSVPAGGPLGRRAGRRGAGWPPAFRRPRHRRTHPHTRGWLRSHRRAHEPDRSRWPGLGWSGQVVSRS